MSGRPEGVTQASRERGHEQSDLSVRMLFGGLAILVAFTALAAFAMVGLFGVLDARETARQAPPSPLVQTDVTPPQPRLESSPREVRDRIDALRAMQLSTYTWIDRQGGIARIPVDRAMEILAARGLPHRPAPEPQQ
jgi:hypothetical protein